MSEYTTYTRVQNRLGKDKPGQTIIEEYITDRSAEIEEESGATYAVTDSQYNFIRGLCTDMVLKDAYRWHFNKSKDQAQRTQYQNEIRTLESDIQRKLPKITKGNFWVKSTTE